MSTTQQPEALRDARWYMIDKDGMATLCTDREDAEKEAKNANMAWPHTAPHRAVQLVEVDSIAASAGTTDYRGWGYAKLPEPVAYSLGLAKYAHSSNIIAANEFTPDTEHADEWESLVTMDQARDFADRTHEFRERRGDESIAANAGSEPVATVFTMDALAPGGGVKYHATVHKPLPAGTKLYTHPSPPEGMVGGWISVDERMPEPGTPVLLDIGEKYPIRAMWAAKHTLEVCMEDDSEFGEYDEATDTYYCPEGWYEWNEQEDVHWRVDKTPRAWAPLPPTTATGSGKGE